MVVFELPDDDSFILGANALCPLEINSMHSQSEFSGLPVREGVLIKFGHEEQHKLHCHNFLLNFSPSIPRKYVCKVPLKEYSVNRKRKLNFFPVFSCFEIVHYDTRSRKGTAQFFTDRRVQALNK